MARLPKLIRTVLSPPDVDRSTALALTERLSAVTHLVSSLEYLAAESDREPGGLNNWAVTRANFAATSPRLRKVLDALGDRRTTKALNLVRVGAAVSLLAPTPRPVRLAANAVLSATSLALHPRNLYGTDGSDQVSFLVQTAATVARAGERRPQLVDACLWFLALQSTLSYSVSGWVKLVSPTWRSGRALPGVMRTLTYGDRATWEFLRDRPRLTQALCAGVLALESAFPVVFLGRGRPAHLVIGSVGAFHVVNARLMGLGRFVWSFAAMHPAVLYASGPRERTGADGRTYRRDDALPVVAGGLLAAALGGALLASAHRARLVTAGRRDERTVTTSAGNTLRYRITGTGTDPQSAGEPAPERPLFVLENALVASAEHWEWITRALGEHHRVVTYHRAGYGPSTYAGGDDYRLDTAVDDLTDLVRHVAGDRPVVLVGHSLGGYLALKAAALLPGQVRGIVLLDSSHPAQLRRSEQQAQGAASLSGTLALLPLSLSFGLGALMKRPDWVDRMPDDVRTLMAAQYRDARMWRTARREWRAAQEDFEACEGRLPRIDAPALVLTAGLTGVQDPVQTELHDELAGAARGSVRQVVEGVDHDGLLSVREAAEHVVKLVTAFTDELDRPERESSTFRHPENSGDRDDEGTKAP
ncbi:alpha/beta fold hydrolase [Streptomyces sp. NPDC091281]|uniref:alpha/beta fold hydrolase n=1 Tax=Streptomyces sp. NPDC091281 TaxID=3365985 RepID=UPI003816A8EA